jgi:hypothetical protein
MLIILLYCHVITYLAPNRLSPSRIEIIRLLISLFSLAVAVKLQQWHHIVGGTNIWPDQISVTWQNVEKSSQTRWFRFHGTCRHPQGTRTHLLSNTWPESHEAGQQECCFTKPKQQQTHERLWWKAAGQSYWLTNTITPVGGVRQGLGWLKSEGVVRLLGYTSGSILFILNHKR